MEAISALQNDLDAVAKRQRTVGGSAREIAATIGLLSSLHDSLDGEGVWLARQASSCPSCPSGLSCPSCPSKHAQLPTEPLRCHPIQPLRCALPRGPRPPRPRPATATPPPAALPQC